MSAPSATLPIVVIGAGIVGACVATYLRRDGHAVTLVDMNPPGEGASFGNAGCLNGSSVVPVAMPGTWKNVPGWLMDPLGPLAIRWTYLPTLAPWLWRFIRSATPEKVEAQAKALRPLLAPSVDTYRELLRDAGAEHLVHRVGHLFAYRTRAGFDKDATAMALRERNGIQIDVLGTDELRQLEPNLSRDFQHGRLVSENGHCENPHAMVNALAEALVRAGGEVRRAKVTGFAQDGGKVTTVRTEQGDITCSGVVLAAGAWSKPLAEALGDSPPLDTERGYHVMIETPEVAPRVPTMDCDLKAVATPMATGLRVAGTVEFAGIAAPPNWGRADKLLRVARMMYPSLPAGIAEARVKKWMGFRPSMPDSLPVIDRATGTANAWYAFGHGHVGLAAGAMTGRLVADLVGGRTPVIDPAPYAARRFA
jgi:D-amino-acid dehydrogenase